MSARPDASPVTSAASSSLSGLPATVRDSRPLPSASRAASASGADPAERPDQPVHVLVPAHQPEVAEPTRGGGLPRNRENQSR